MSWLRLDDTFPQHPKLSGWTAAQKWALIELFTYCARHRTEGHVPADLSLLPRAVTQKVLELAEESGIVDRENDGSLTVHDWSTYNPSDPTAAERMQRMRERNVRRNDNRNQVRNETVSSRTRLPSRPTEASNDASAERVQDELWDTLVQELGGVETKSERGKRNTALKELRDVGATPDEVRQRCAAYRQKWPHLTLTATALTAHWSSLVHQPKPRSSATEEVDLNLPEISEKERLANLERLKAMTA